MVNPCSKAQDEVTEYNHGMVWLGESLKGHLIQPLCREQEHFQPGQTVQSPVQPGVECFSDEVSTPSLGTLFQCLTTLTIKNLFPRLVLIDPLSI